MGVDDFADPWLAACEAGDLAAMRAALAGGVDIDAIQYGSTGLMGAAMRGRPEAVAFLLAAGADPGIVPPGAVRPESALSRAMEGNGDPDVAMSEGHEECVRLLMPPATDPGHPNRPCDAALRASAPWGRTPWPAEHGRLRGMVDWVEGSPVGAELLCGEARSRNWAAMEDLLAKGLGVDALHAGKSLLVRAAISGDRELAAWAMDHGADVDRLNEEDGYTPIMLCVQGAFHSSAGSASRADHLELLKDLLAKGASVDARSGNGATALIMASLFGQMECVEALLSAGADHEVKVPFGDGEANAEMAAIAMAQEGIASHLRQFSAMVSERAELSANEPASRASRASRAARPSAKPKGI